MTEPGTPPVLGVIGGSGLYEIDGLTDTRWETVESPFGKPSDDLLHGNLAGQKIVFFPQSYSSQRMSHHNNSLRPC